AVSGIVAGNELSNIGDAGINVGSAIEACDGLIISNNTVTNAGAVGTPNNAGAINLYSDCTNITITGNTLADSWDGITIKDVGALGSGITVSLNNITGNSHYGVLNSAVSGTLDAEDNWWGNASGPQLDDAVYTSYGDKVSANVDYEPWLLEEQETATTFDKTLALKDEWTLVSTDKEVTTGSDLVGETLAYRYALDPDSGNLAFLEAAATNLEPVSALYVKTVGGGGVGIIYAPGAPGVSSKDLVAGWNLISSGTVAPVGAVLSPLRDIAQTGAGLTTLVSQG
ncbi:unnamed protein product, partial [marine sediment metagenome]